MPADCGRSGIPTWPHIPRKFTRPSHLGFAIAPNHLFLRPGAVARVGSIPIARSILVVPHWAGVVLGGVLARLFVSKITMRPRLRPLGSHF
jgi:hypothetical protein